MLLCRMAASRIVSWAKKMAIFRDDRPVLSIFCDSLLGSFCIVWPPFSADVLEAAGLATDRVYKVKEGRPNVVDLLKGEKIQLVINTPHGLEPWFDEKAIRRAAVTHHIPTITTLSAARAAAEGIAARQRGQVSVRALQQLHAERLASAER